ncbi:3-deoxy-7-phosphoheptulonate synthase [Corynebacterium epidermidicanis]|uniref:Phospho-2-dehydro-3-deoxyheptonate aldolase n=1 Tax=Corynebacterium epidermidicanis TaxID=1050174 RepID=A0A0G3GNM6_9CORY|nr:3-deoxy-7-phosphoheptulonate synthase [Corynebacterium epidermidicanis]AKK02749.1 3-deoxy-D-arabinoheptulosonate-7-phosphate synthase [Corynebacterium epidermidicanis]
MSAPVSLQDAASTSNRRVIAFHDLPSPAELLAQLPLSVQQAAKVERDRQEIADIFAGEDDRLVVVVGPCSIHDPNAALEYAHRLAPLAQLLSDDLKIVMRVYFEKPRTTIGWKGLINDPHLDGTYDIAYGLRLARQVVVDVLNTGLPVGCEFLEPNSPQYYADAVAWGAIGARTTESQVHRQLASGMSMPIGFKNGTDGNVQVAVDAVQAASHQHFFFGTSDEGHPAVVETAGNDNCHIILRGGTSGPNYSPEHIAAAEESMSAGQLRERRLMIDASHANSNKDDERQLLVLREIAQHIADPDAATAHSIAGVMIESFLVAGAQKLDPAKLRKNGGEGLAYGQSVTDRCIDIASTVDVLEELAQAVRTRRAGKRDLAQPSGDDQ